MLWSFQWVQDTAAADESDWVTGLFIVRLLVVPPMLVIVMRIGYRAITIMRGRTEARAPAANSAILYCGVTAAYISLGMFVPAFWAAVPVIVEPVLYPMAALLLLVATVRALRVDGQLPGRLVVSPPMTTILVASACAVVIGASAAYARSVLTGDPVMCVGGECPPERTLGAVGFMVVAAMVTAAMIARGLRSPTGMPWSCIIGAVAFACLALMFPAAIMPAFVLPYDAFVPSFFYAAAAIAFLIVAVARRADDSLPPQAP